MGKNGGIFVIIWSVDIASTSHVCKANNTLVHEHCILNYKAKCNKTVSSNLVVFYFTVGNSLI